MPASCPDIPPSLQRLLLALVVFSAAFWMFTQHNDFPWQYHNDEFTKVEQITSNWRNLNHPTLMLEIIRAASAVRGDGDDPQAIVQTGRLLSAVYLALACVLMADLAFAISGFMAGFLVATALLVQADFFETGHYLKEDTLFLLFLAAVFRAAAAYGTRPDNNHAIFLALTTAGLAGSKYIGWLLAPVIAFWMYSQARGKRNLRTAVVTFAITTLLLYLPSLFHPHVWMKAGNREFTQLVGGDYGTGVPIPHSLYWQLLLGVFGPVLLCSGLACFLLAGKKDRPPGGLLMFGTAATAMLMMAWITKYSDRYLLPVSLLVTFMVVTGPGILAHRWTGNRHTWIPSLAMLAATALLCFHQIPDWLTRREGFTRDSRAELKTWMETHLDGPIVLAEDQMARMEGAPHVEKTEQSFFVADLGSLPELQAQGITHVVVSYDVYHRYVDGSTPHASGVSEEFKRRQAFYTALFSEGKLLWQSGNQKPKALHPGLSLVEIRQSPRP